MDLDVEWEKNKTQGWLWTGKKGIVINWDGKEWGMQGKIQSSVLVL